MADIRSAWYLLFRSRSESCAASLPPKKTRRHIPEHPERKKVDPIATNGEIFVGWPKPDVALVFSGEQNGYLEPCGLHGTRVSPTPIVDRDRAGDAVVPAGHSALCDFGWSSPSPSSPTQCRASICL